MDDRDRPVVDALDGGPARRLRERNVRAASSAGGARRRTRDGAVGHGMSSDKQPIIADNNRSDAGRATGRFDVHVVASIITTIVLAGAFALIGGAIQRKAVFPIALAAAAVVAAIPIGGAVLVRFAYAHLGGTPSSLAIAWLTLLIAAFVGTFVFGAFLSLLTLLGFEHLQALTALDHPGFKHFVRLRVRADGSGVDGWCIGATDPLRAGQKPELVDHFTWRPRTRHR